MARKFQIALCALAVMAAVGTAHAAPQLLAPPMKLDPTRMFLRAGLSNQFDVATLFVEREAVTALTAFVWCKWTPRPSLRPYCDDPTLSHMYAMLCAMSCTVDAARATREGGASLTNLCAHPYATPITLSGGRWSSTCLPSGYAYPDNLDKWQYGCYTVNVQTDYPLTLTVAGCERSVPASAEMQVFNIQGETASRAVIVAASSASATVRIGVAEQPLHQFVGSQSDNARPGTYAFDNVYGCFAHDEWRMAVFRARIEGGNVICNSRMYTRTARCENERTETTAMWHPRATFARNARVRFSCACVLGQRAEGEAEVFDVYGVRGFSSWMTDAEIERQRDLDAAEMSRRGMFN